MSQQDLEQRLRSAIREGVDPDAPPWLRARIHAIPDTNPTASRGASPSWLWLGRSRAVSVALIAAIVVALSVGLGLLAYRNVGTAPPTPSPASWSGPVRADATVMPVLPLIDDAEVGAWTWSDGPDAAVPWVDIGAIQWSPQGGPSWSIDLAGWPARGEGLDRERTIIAYGVVIDTNRDRVPDYEFGIDNDAPEPGDVRTWLTNLATGHSNEKVGPPYGYPVEFSHPDEHDPDHIMSFRLLPGSRPSGPPEEVLPSDQWQFYVWATVTEGGAVVAWDYGPDVAWLTQTAP